MTNITLFMLVTNCFSVGLLSTGRHPSLNNAVSQGVCGVGQEVVILFVERLLTSKFKFVVGKGYGFLPSVMSHPNYNAVHNYEV